MTYLETLTAQINQDYWIVLDQDRRGNWAFLVWGAQPAGGEFGRVSEESAKEQALLAAKRHFEQLGLQGEFDNVHWRVAVRQMVA